MSAPKLQGAAMGAHYRCHDLECPGHAIELPLCPDAPKGESQIFMLTKLDGDRLLKILREAIPALVHEKQLGYEAMREMMELHDRIEEQTP